MKRNGLFAVSQSYSTHIQSFRLAKTVTSVLDERSGTNPKFTLWVKGLASYASQLNICFAVLLQKTILIILISLSQSMHSQFNRADSSLMYVEKYQCFFWKD